MSEKEILEQRCSKLRECVDFIFRLNDNVTYGSNEYLKMLLSECNKTLDEDDKLIEKEKRSITMDIALAEYVYDNERKSFLENAELDPQMEEELDALFSEFTKASYRDRLEFILAELPEEGESLFKKAVCALVELEELGSNPTPVEYNNDFEFREGDEENYDHRGLDDRKQFRFDMLRVMKKQGIKACGIIHVTEHDGKDCVDYEGLQYVDVDMNLMKSGVKQLEEFCDDVIVQRVARSTELVTD